jgi:hypothetical protein
MWAIVAAARAKTQPAPSPCPHCEDVGGSGSTRLDTTAEAWARCWAGAAPRRQFSRTPCRKAEPALARRLRAETLRARTRRGRLRSRRARASRGSCRRAQERWPDLLERPPHTRRANSTRRQTSRSMHPWPTTPWARDPSLSAPGSRAPCDSNQCKALLRRLPVCSTLTPCVKEASAARMVPHLNSSALLARGWGNHIRALVRTCWIALSLTSPWLGGLHQGYRAAA